MTPLIFLLLIGLTFAQAAQLRAPISNTTNMTDPSSTEVLSTISIKSEFTTISPDGKTLLLYNSATNSIGVYGVTNLQSPTLSSSISFEFASQYLAFSVMSPDSKTGYIVHDNQGAGELMIVDLSDTLSPVTLSTFNLSSGIGPAVLSADGQTIFIWGCPPQNSGIESAVMIIDVSNPTSPTTLSFSEEIGSCSSRDSFLRLSGDHLIYNQDSILEILNISNLTSPTLVLMHNMPANLASLVLSSDGNTAFVIEQDTSNDSGSDSTSLVVLNLTNLTSIQEIASLTFDSYIDASGLGAIAISPDSSYIFMAGSDVLLVVDVSDVQNMSYKAVETISEPTFVALSPDGRTLFVTSEAQVSIMELYIDRQSSQKFTFPSNSIQEFTLPSQWGILENMLISHDQKTAFVAYEFIFAIFDISNKTASTLLGVYELTQSYIVSIIISADEKTAYLSLAYQVLVLDISNVTSPALINTLSISDPFQPLIISSNGQIAFVKTPYGFQIVNVSDLAAPINISTYNSSVDNANTAYALALSQDETTIFLVYEGWNVFVLETIDVSDLSSPKMINSLEMSDESDDYPASISVSPDKKAVFINFRPFFGQEFEVIDLSNPASPIHIDWSDYNIKTSQQVIISSDSSTAFIATNTELLLMDIRRLATPQILRAYPIIETVSMFLSDDESTMYLAASNGTWIEVNLQPQYALEMWSNDFVLGEVYSNTLEAFQISNNRYLEPMNQSYSFATMSLYSVTFLSGTNNTETVVTYPLLPNWIEFDQSHGIVTFSPSTQDQTGTYQIYSAMSFLIPEDIFVGVGNITNQTESTNLIVSLMSLGYMNTQRFLSSGYNPNTKLYLSSEYSSFEADIRSKLAPYYIEMTTSFAVDSSLSLSSSRHISVSTKSENTVSMTISISQGNASQAQAQFVQGNYPILATYSSYQSTITMQGTLTSLNNALTELIINLNDNVTSCDGSIIVSDGLNPILTQEITNISRYFALNQAPTLAYSIEDEINQTQIYTGDQFIIQINGTFADPNGQDLDYSISMQDGTQVPDWLTLRDSSLVGTPPEKVTDSEINIIITAKNQFKSSQQLVTLNIKISLLYALKLIGTYGGGFITAVGLWIYMSTIHNIFCKKRYKYPKDHFIKVGDEQSVRNICSIAFIAKEIKASHIVLKEIKKTIAAERNIKWLNNSHVAAYFVNSKSGKLNEDKFVEMTRAAMQKLGIIDMSQSDESSYVKGYLRKEVIQLIVLDRILHYQLSLSKEASTKYIFDRAQKYWAAFIETTPNPLEFRLNRTEFRKILKEKDIVIQAKGTSLVQDSEVVSSEKVSLNDAEDTIEVNYHHQISRFDEEPSLPSKQEQNQAQTPLLQNGPRQSLSNVNSDLLERLLINTAFKYHNLDMNAYDIKVVVNQKPSGNRLWLNTKKLFKHELAIIEFAGKGELAYGIRYEVKKGILKFYGAPEEDLKGETLVVQVTNKRGWILRELWLHCVAGSVKIENRDL